jgi:replicative DNA helicase
MGFFSYLTYLIENKYMGKFYEDLDTLIELIKKIDKKRQLAEFIIRLVRNAKENPNKSVSDVIKETKKEFDK